MIKEKETFWLPCGALYPAAKVTGFTAHYHNKIDKIQRLFDNEHAVRPQSDKKVKELNAKLDKLQEKLDAN